MSLTPGNMVVLKTHHISLALENVPQSLLPHIQFIFRPFITANHQANIHGTISIEKTNNQTLVIKEGGEVRFQGPESHGVMALVNLLNIKFLLETRNYLTLHAASLRTSPSKAIVIAGASNNGKSTLTLYLVEKGLGFLGDEGIFVTPGTALFLPYPRAVSYPWGEFPKRLNKFCRSRISESVSYFRPREECISTYRIPHRIEALVFVARGEATRFTPIDKKETLLELGKHVLGAPRGVLVESLLDIAQQVTLSYKASWSRWEDLFLLGDEILDKVAHLV